MNNVLVLGGTGFVGRSVCRRLAEAHWRVTVPTRRVQHAAGVQFVPRLTVLEADVHDPQALRRALQGQDAVVNLVAILHGTPAEFERAHVQLPQTLLQACLDTGVRQLVHVSALGADATRAESLPSHYLRSKSRGEAVLLAGAAQNPGLQVHLLRPSVIFGAGDRFLNTFAQLQRLAPFVPLAGAQAQFQPVWVEDVAQAVQRLLERQTAERTAALPDVLEACGPRVYTLAELVRLSAQWAGLRRLPPIVPLSEGLARWQARLMECAPGEPVLTRDNLDSMRVPNIASGTVPGLERLGIAVQALEAIAPGYLARAR